MPKFQLELLFRIIGIGSASGLFFNNNSLYLIADNSLVLYEYNIDTKKLEKHPVAGSSPTENIAKKDKPDFEAIAADDNVLYLFGSGSTDKRNLVIAFDPETKKAAPATDVTDLYLNMQDFGQIYAANFNIEAAVYDKGTWYLFNRGNGPKKQNGIYTITGDLWLGSYQILYNDIELPAIHGAQSGFTDAVAANGKLYFIAAAEKSDSTYHDGEVAGSLAGRIDMETMEVEFTHLISGKHKFEGITIYRETPKAIEFLLCEDTDSDINESDIFKLTIDK